MTPAEELRAAATKLRETAKTGPWQWTCSKPDDNGLTQVYDKAGMWPLGGFVADCRNPAVAAWVALASPALAEPLAAWLERCAEDLTIAALAVTKWPDGETRDPADYVDEPDSAHHALTVARAINGSPS